jgi:hypothetical protein
VLVSAALSTRCRRDNADMVIEVDWLDHFIYLLLISSRLCLSFCHVSSSNIPRLNNT